MSPAAVSLAIKAALNYHDPSFESDIVIMDCRVRGFTRDVNGKKHYIDHRINSIRTFSPATPARRYQMIDVNVYQENIFHTKMMLKEFDLDSYLFGVDVDDVSPKSSAISKTRSGADAGDLLRAQHHPQRETVLIRSAPGMLRRTGTGSASRCTAIAWRAGGAFSLKNVSAPPQRQPVSSAQTLSRAR